MAVIIPIDLGTLPNDGTGDPLRVGGQSININFANLNTDKLESGGYTGTGQDLFTLANNKVSKTGDTMTGDLVMQNKNIKSPLATLTLGGQNILYADIAVNDAEYLLAVGKTLNVIGQTKNSAMFGLSNTLGNTQIVQNVIVGGELNVIDGLVDDSIVSGTGNTHEALASFTIGNSNTNNGTYNLLSGINNTINGRGNTVSGDTNILQSGEYNAIFGRNNNLGVSCHNNIIGGVNNETFAPSSHNIMGGVDNQSILGGSILSGKGNTANALYNIISGVENTSTAPSTFVIGNDNSVLGGGNSVVYGISNLCNGTNALVGGKSNQSLSSSSNFTMIGKGLQNNKSDEHIFGLYNAPTTDGIFTIGYGTNVDRKNAFVVTELGNLRTPKLLLTSAKNDIDASALNVGIGEQYISYGKRVVVRKNNSPQNNNIIGSMLSFSGSFINFGGNPGTSFPTDGDACQFGVTPNALSDHTGNLAVIYQANISKVSCKWSSQDNFNNLVGTAVVSFKFYKADINDDLSLTASWTAIHTLTTTWDNTSGTHPGFIEDVLPSEITVNENTILAFVAETTVGIGNNEEVEVTLILENQ